MMGANVALSVSAGSGTSLPPAPRPRLVAKTASGTKGPAPSQAHAGSKNGAAGPDPMQVWNRNRGLYTGYWTSIRARADSIQLLPNPSQNTSRTRSSSSNMAYTLRHGYRPIATAKRRNGLISTMMRTTGRRKRLSGMMVLR